MATKPRPSGTRAYFDALAKIFALESQVLTGALPHYGERGANDEERLRRFLERTLPRRFAVGTGFIVCSNPAVERSSQTDIVIYDDLLNPQWHRELVAGVFPIETVYGTIEVKSSLTRKDLSQIAKDIAKIRRLAPERRYVLHQPKAKSPETPDKFVSGSVIYSTKVPPRAFVFAYSAHGWKRPDSLKRALEKAAANGSHTHGLIVLDRNWYFVQEAHPRNGPTFHFREGDALLLFLHSLIDSMASLGQRGQADMQSYFAQAIAGEA